MPTGYRAFGYQGDKTCVLEMGNIEDCVGTWGHEIYIPGTVERIRTNTFEEVATTKSIGISIGPDTKVISYLLQEGDITRKWLDKRVSF